MGMVRSCLKRVLVKVTAQWTVRTFLLCSRTKVFVSYAGSTKEEDSSGIVIEEAEFVDCDGDAVPEDGVRYQEALAYRVVQVNGSSSSNEIELPVGQPTNNTRDDRRRATHNEVERRRRDKINNWIAKLGKIIPECNANTSGNGSSGGEGKTNYETQSKGGILAKACEYIGELRAANQGLGQCVRDNEKLRQEINALKQLVTQLKRENAQLRSQISPPTTTVDNVHISS
ncbi:transcriptional regulator CBF1-like isoform X3 [Orussus abietinus]|uniref:transcriptional regulator CBF1-like isoform X3 n=1 Tax=Orussus abietinus TaxID=222816 RepID=UPI000C715B19|nr:transcriptional regulator CBF1-like isoform X3 [Orussus abietinus]